MAAATYTSDLTAKTISTAESVTNWAEASASGWTNGANPAIEPDFYIQGSNCIAKYNPNAPIGQNGMLYNNTASITFAAGECLFVWVNNQCPNNMDTEAANGLELLLGSSLAAFKAWTVLGSDSYTYGGWVNAVVDPTVAVSRTVGSPTNNQYIGVGIKYLTTAKGGLGVDVMRYGRGQLQCLNGDLANGYATFAAAAAQNDLNANRWGLLQVISAGYLYKGLFLLGDAATAVDFRDSNKSIYVDNTKKVTSTFNTIEIRNASSRVDWTNINIVSLGTTSKGRLVVTNNADVNFDACTFTGFGTSAYQSNSTILNSVFRSCDQVSPVGATMTNCEFISSTDTTGAVVANASTDLDSMTYCTFTNNTRAIRITTAGTYNFVGHQFSGGTYHVDFTGTGTCTIIPSSGCNVLQGSCTASGGGTITVNASSYNLTFTGLQTGSEVRVIKVSDGSELDGVESSTASYTYSHALGGTLVDIYIHHNEYQWYPIRNYTLLSSNTEIPIQQIKDRQYLNP